MIGKLIRYNSASKCNWCEKEAEGITVEFAENFLHKGPLCFKCFQQAVRVHYKQYQSSDLTPSTKREAS